MMTISSASIVAAEVRSNKLTRTVEAGAIVSGTFGPDDGIDEYLGVEPFELELQIFSEPKLFC